MKTAKNKLRLRSETLFSFNKIASRTSVEMKTHTVITTITTTSSFPIGMGKAIRTDI